MWAYIGDCSLNGMTNTSSGNVNSNYDNNNNNNNNNNRGYLQLLQSRSKSLQPSAAQQPPESDGKMSAASHRRHRVFGG